MVAGGQVAGSAAAAPGQAGGPRRVSRPRQRVEGRVLLGVHAVQAVAERGHQVALQQAAATSPLGLRGKAGNALGLATGVA